jgi:hypothetical protein
MKMNCLACNGKIKVLMPSNGLDLQGTCSACGAVQLASERYVLAKRWYSCKDVKPEQETYFFVLSGGHGWIHNVCGQITQLG